MTTTGLPPTDAELAGRPTSAALAELRGSGMLGTLVPRMFGGWGADAVLANRVVADVARTDPSLAIVLFQHLAVSARIAQWGSPEQRSALLPELASGRVLTASAWSEAGAGANKKNLQTLAVEQEDGSWSLTGVKSFVTGSGIADLYLVLTQSDQVDDERSTYGSAGQTFFLVPADTPGLSIGPVFDLDGMQASATASVRLDGCVLPAGAVLGRIGGATEIIASVRESGVTLGAVSLGIAESAYDCAAAHARRAGTLSHQVTRHRLVDMAAHLEAARGCIERTGRCESDDPGLTTLYSKLFVSAAAEQLCADARTVLGSAGYLRTHAINQLTRDARAIALMGPTNELCRELVGASWLV